MIVSNNLKSSLVYRFHVGFQIIASMVTIVILYFLWKSVFHANPTAAIRGMTFSQTFLYVSLATAIAVLMRTWTDWDICNQIRSGDIVMSFFKPVDYMRYVFLNAVGTMAGSFVTITIPSLVILFGVFRANLAIGWNIPFFIPTLAFSCALSFLFDFIVGTTSFWTMSIWGISVAKDFSILFFSGALVPLNFFPDAFVAVLRFLPFAYMYNLPLSILTANEANPALWAHGLLTQVAWLAVIYVIARVYFKFSLKNLTVNGG